MNCLLQYDIYGETGFPAVSSSWEDYLSVVIEQGEEEVIMDASSQVFQNKRRKVDTNH